MRYFTWVTAQLQQLLFVVLAAGLWCFTAGCHVKSPLLSSPNPLSNRSVLHDGRKHKTASFHNPAQRLPRICTSYKFAAPRYRLPCRLFRWASNLTFQRQPFNVVTKTKSLCPSPLPRFQQRCLCTSPTMGESTSTIQRSPRISTSHKFAAPRCRLPPMVLQTVQMSVEPHLSTALKDRSVVPYSSPKVSARLRYHVSNSVLFVHRAGTLAKGYPLCKLFSRAEPVPFEKEININLVYSNSSCLKHANEMLLGDPRQADLRTQSFHFPIVIHQALDPAARSSAQAPSALSLHAALDRLITRRRVGSTRTASCYADRAAGHR